MAIGIGLILLLGIGIGLFSLVVWILNLRRVVEPNEVHIVQNSKGATAYGATRQTDGEGEGILGETLNGNSYYEWPSWLPYWGVQVIVLPLSVFQLDLPNYEAYDIGKVPFTVDVVAFFRIDNPAVAAKRISSEQELKHQLMAILQGAVRTILAKHEVETIMEERSQYGEMFTEQVATQLKAWGVRNVKNIELMDIRDGHDSRTISNIMAKKESLIDMQSRTEVAENQRAAKEAEIVAAREVAVRDQEAQQAVGERTAEKDKQIGIANEHANQEIKTEARETKERDMAIVRVAEVRSAEIKKQAQIVEAEQQRETMKVEAEGVQQQTVIVAEGKLQEQRKNAEGILAIGTSEAEAKRLSEMAVVDPQLALASEIGENERYQSYLIQIRKVEKDEVVGQEQARALQAANIKVISNTGHPTKGVDSVMDLFSSKGGTEVGAALEAFLQTEAGERLMKGFGMPISGGNGQAA